MLINKQKLLKSIGYTLALFGTLTLATLLIATAYLCLSAWLFYTIDVVLLIGVMVVFDYKIRD